MWNDLNNMDYETDPIYESMIQRLIERNKLYEGLILSDDPLKVKLALISNFKYMNKRVHYLDSDIKLIVRDVGWSNISTDIFSDIESINKTVDIFGWHLSEIQYKQNNEINISNIDKLKMLYNDNEIEQLFIIFKPKYKLRVEVESFFDRYIG